MKATISSYEEYCRVWAGVYKKHAQHCHRSLFSCYVRDGIHNALWTTTPKYPRPSKRITSDEDIIGLYIVRALVAQGMSERLIEEYTVTMQGYVDESGGDPTDAMMYGLRKLGVDCFSTRIEHGSNRLRYLWAKHGGFALSEDDLVEDDS